ncbi:MAG: GatB/YqeY domain-containing protein [Anaerolineales bacterium]
MTKKADLEQALKDAMRSNDATRKNTMRVALTAVKEAEVQKKGELDDAAVVAILQKELKSRQEAQEEAEKAGRADLVKNAKAEIQILEGFLPAPMTQEELDAIVLSAINETGASSMSDMGRVMKLAMQKAEGRADGNQLSQAVRSKLSA